MKKYFIVLAVYNDHRQYIFDTYISPRNKLYCKEQGYNYIEIKNINIIRNSITWSKFNIVKDLINDGTLKNDDIVIHLDADAWIVDITKSLDTNKSFSYAIDSGNSHCMGMYSLRINDWSKKMINLLLDEDRYKKLINYETEHNGSKSSFWKIFKEQASWYSLAGIQRHSWIPFWDIKDFGWNSNKDEFTIYSLEDLYENVELLPTQYNVTLLENEHTSKYYIIPLEREKVIIRHFAGGGFGLNWNLNWFNSFPKIIESGGSGVNNITLGNKN